MTDQRITTALAQVDAPAGTRSRISTQSQAPQMATPGLAFWGGMTLVAAAEEIGRWYG